MIGRPRLSEDKEKLTRRVVCVVLAIAEQPGTVVPFVDVCLALRELGLDQFQSADALAEAGLFGVYELNDTDKTFQLSEKGRRVYRLWTILNDDQQGPAPPKAK